ncbi:clostripain-related cysteine peptidase [Burkholderia sp. BE17]|uniref:clostripain-related cysteine peptidase n=1 Tax=Burkholderia sp. BE17 TaxID=2656644 RepID=UPI00128CABF4|nr:clostripain-related cysteine peptidase [Burkholderia sp. BE17]MPV66155.1 hypothetical protein [Burkholderia sp. BE17]
MKIILREVRRHLLSIVGGFLIVFLSACGGGGDDIDSSTSADHTLLVYMVGADPTMTLNAQKSLGQMTAATAGTRLNLVVTTGAGNGVVDGVDWSHTQRWVLRDGQKTKLADLGQQDMTRPDTLRDFLVWGIRNYPAKRYTIILNDHGGSYRGFGFVGNSHLSLTDLVSAFDGAKKITGASFDLIGFDACMMASVEVAAALQPYGRYLAASEDLEYHPWDYASIVAGIASKPDMDGEALGELIANTYFTYTRYNADFTFSVLDLSQVPQLLAAINDLGAELKSGNYSTLQMAKIRSEAQSFSTDWTTATDVVDLMQLSRGLTDGLEPPLATTDAVITPLINKVVIHRSAGTSRIETGGLNIFMPAGAAYDSSLLKEYALTKQWMGAYQDFVGQYAEALNLSLDVAINLADPVAYQGVISSVVTFPQIWNNKNPLAVISYWDEKGKIYYAMLPTDAASPAVVDGVDIDPSFALMVKRNAVDSIYAIDGVPVSLIPTTAPSTEFPGKYVIPVGKGEGGCGKPEDGFLLVTENGASHRMAVAGYVSSLGGAAGYATPVEKFDDKWVMCPKAWYGGAWISNDGQAVKVNKNNMSVEKIAVPVANYELSFAVADFANRLHVSKPISVVTSQAGPTQSRAFAEASH